MPSSDFKARNGRTSFRSKHTEYRNNADKVLSVFVDSNAPEFEDQVREAASAVCTFLNPSFEMAEQETDSKERKYNPLIVKTLTGGTSNELFIVSRTTSSAPPSSSSSSSSVLVRIHPNNDDEGVVDRDVENQLAAWLSEQGIGPTYYGRFENGRVEEFYQNVAPLTSHEMPNYAPQIAQAMADFHCLEAPSTILPKPHTANHYAMIENWLDQAKNTSIPSRPVEASLLQELHSEWKWLKPQLDATPSADSPIESQALLFIRQLVLTHMDCQSLNILKDASGSIRLIDFEYAGWNPRAADIANTFCEYCDMNNISADYEKEYPSDEAQNDYLKNYVLQSSPDLAQQLSALQQWESFLAPIRSEIGRFSLLSHLGWSIWCIVKAKEESAIDFDYLAYARHRMDGYYLSKKKYFC